MPRGLLEEFGDCFSENYIYYARANVDFAPTRNRLSPNEKPPIYSILGEGKFLGITKKERLFFELHLVRIRDFYSIIIESLFNSFVSLKINIPIVFGHSSRAHR